MSGRAGHTHRRWRLSGHKKPMIDVVRNDINVTPLVDVMLVLLIIFMLMTLIMGRGHDVILPKAKNYSQEARPGRARHAQGDGRRGPGGVEGAEEPRRRRPDLPQGRQQGRVRQGLSGARVHEQGHDPAAGRPRHRQGRRLHGEGITSHGDVNG
ncbi:MAG: hypothetical protein E6J90_15040 [Deltaproteobacteria bacterium]|nr:MAG: hypothetical protein E6J90_15040 [Deltaproteobacteria bacterium]